MQLKKTLEKVISLHTEVLKPISLRVQRERQLYLFSQLCTPTNILGDFYERVTLGFYGGRLSNQRYFDEFDETKETKPDVLDSRNHRAHESKACCSGQILNLFDEQVKGYAALQKENSKLRIAYAFYRHSLRRIKSFKGTEEELVHSMADKTFYSLVLPLSVILKMHNKPAWFKDKFLIRWEGGAAYMTYREGAQRNYCRSGQRACTRVKSPTFNSIFVSPEETLTDLGLDPREYAFERLLSPTKFQVNGTKINQFPILRVRDKNHEDWIEKFAREFKPIYLPEIKEINKPNEEEVDESPLSEETPISKPKEDDEGEDIPF